VYSSTNYCPSCDSRLTESFVSLSQFNNTLETSAGSLARVAKNEGVDIECKIEQGNKYTGEYRSANLNVKPRR